MRNNNSCFVGVHVRKCEARKGLPCLEDGVIFMGPMLFPISCSAQLSSLHSLS